MLCIGGPIKYKLKADSGIGHQYNLNSTSCQTHTNHSILAHNLLKFRNQYKNCPESTHFRNNQVIYIPIPTTLQKLNPPAEPDSVTVSGYRLYTGHFKNFYGKTN